jgi:hypothetical protein
MCGVPTAAVRLMLPGDTSAVALLTTELGYPATEDEIRRRYDVIADHPDARLFVARPPGLSRCHLNRHRRSIPGPTLRLPRRAYIVF